MARVQVDDDALRTPLSSLVPVEAQTGKSVFVLMVESKTAEGNWIKQVKTKLWTDFERLQKVCFIIIS